MAQKQTEIDINDKGEVILMLGINRARQIILARLEKALGAAYDTIYWKSEDLRDKYHKSVEAFLTTEEITIGTTLMEGQKADVVSPKAPPRPTLHKMQGDLTPDFLEWLVKWAPIEFENTLGVRKRKLKAGESYDEDPRENWMRSDVVRNVTNPTPGTKGGEYLSVRFIQRNQLIARRATHLTFTEKEIYREGPKDAEGNPTQITVEPYKDIYDFALLEKMEKAGKIEVLWKRPGAATAGSMY